MKKEINLTQLIVGCMGWWLIGVIITLIIYLILNLTILNFNGSIPLKKRGNDGN